MAIISPDKIQAFVLAGGKGKRLSAHIQDTPKPLVRINGKPLIEYSLDALSCANVTNVTLVISNMRIKDSYPADCLFTEGIETILYVVYQASAKFNAPYAVFLDGDSVYSENILSSFFYHLNLDDNPDIIIASTRNSFSYTNWFFHLQKNRVIDISPQKNNLPHYAILVKTSSVIEMFRKLNTITDVNSHKIENHFLNGYEEYYLGWGLIFKLCLDNNYTITCDTCDNFFANINTIQDINNCLRFGCEIGFKPV